MTDQLRLHWNKKSHWQSVRAHYGSEHDDWTDGLPSIRNELQLGDDISDEVTRDAVKDTVPVVFHDGSMPIAGKRTHT